MKGQELWYDSTLYRGHTCAYNIVKNNGDEKFDMERFINSTEGELVLERLKYELCLLGPEQWNSDFMVEHWKEKGIEEHIRADSVVYIPERIQKSTEKYPLIIDSHGGGGTLFESTNHGFVELAQEEDFIVFCPKLPEAGYLADNLKRFIKELAVEYPIDCSRVYLVGHSMGCAASIYAAVQYPEDVAAIGVRSGSGIFGSSKETNRPLYDSYRITETMCQAVRKKGLKIPMYLEMGECDMGQTPFVPSVVEGMNHWLSMNHCKSLISDPEKMLGVSAQRNYEEIIDGVQYQFSECLAESGECFVKLSCVENMPHWVSYSFAKIAWDYMKRYRR